MVKNFYPSTVKSFLFTFILFFASYQSAHATHAMGADMTYICTGPNTYQVVLTFYRDCNGILPNSTQIVTVTSATCGVNTSITLTEIDGMGEVITPLCPSQPDVCNGDAGATYGIEQWVYTGALTLPNGCGDDWELGWTECCRNEAITTLTSSGDQEFYVSAQLDNTLPICNNSPIFNNIPTPFTCVGQPTFYSHGVTDIDGDVLVFSLIDCEEGPGDPVNYETGFNATTPLTTASGVTIDPVTGQISFTPTVAQIGVLCVLVEEYRGGVLIGSVVRDLQYTVVNCANNLPTASGLDGSTDFNASICTPGGETFCFDIVGSDLDVTDVVFMSWNGGIPDANVTFSNNPSANPTMTLCWTPDVSDVGNNVFTVTVEDDSCPLQGSNVFSFNLSVSVNTNPPVDAGVDQTLCTGESTTLAASASGSPTYTWTPTTGLSSPNASTTTAAPTSTTVYTVTAEYADGCISSDQVTITVEDSPSVAAIPSTIDICPSSTATLMATADPSVTFEWFEGVGTGGPSLGAGTVSSGTSSLDVSPSSTTTYTVEVSTGASCTNTAQVTVNVSNPSASTDCTVIHVTDVNSTSDGTQANPTGLLDALSRASCNNTIIKIATGTYDIDSPLDIPSYSTLEGGFDPVAWSKTSLAGATTINRTNTGNDGPANAPALIAIQGNNDTEFLLQDLTFTTDAATDAVLDASGLLQTPAYSTYGVFLTSCSDYDIIRCQIHPGAPGDGADGLMGDNGEGGAVLNGVDGTGIGTDCDGGCTGVNGCPCSGEASGEAGGTGGAGGGGTAAGNSGTGRDGGGGGAGGNGGDECGSNCPINCGYPGSCGGGSASEALNCDFGAGGALNAGSPNPGAPGDPGDNGDNGSTFGTANPGSAGFFDTGTGFWNPGG
ncbi:MAG: hypothetical protein AAF598_16425, partial [Bacteroidota bacterium]